jgi:transposase
MDVVLPHCAGLDGHKQRITACRVSPDPTAQHADGVRDVRDFGTLTIALFALSDGLHQVGVTPVAIASRGEDWKPVYHLLEGTLTVCVVNAAHVKNVPGRNTEKAAARWVAQLRRSGRLHASCIPPQGQRDLRALTRYRTQLVQERSREVNRGQGGLERANLKLASVATDIMGVSGRAMLAARIAGRGEAATMAELARGRMRTKRPVLEQARTGVVRAPHRRLRALQ